MGFAQVIDLVGVIESKSQSHIEHLLSIRMDYLRRSGMLAGATGLEPAASCVTGRRSNQLNYAPALPISYRYRAFLSAPMDSQRFLKMP